VADVKPALLTEFDAAEFAQRIITKEYVPDVEAGDLSVPKQVDVGSDVVSIEEDTDAMYDKMYSKWFADGGDKKGFDAKYSNLESQDAATIETEMVYEPADVEIIGVEPYTFTDGEIDTRALLEEMNRRNQEAARLEAEEAGVEDLESSLVDSNMLHIEDVNDNFDDWSDIQSSLDFGLEDVVETGPVIEESVTVENINANSNAMEEALGDKISAEAESLIGDPMSYAGDYAAITQAVVDGTVTEAMTKIPEAATEFEEVIEAATEYGGIVAEL
jgi:hypothetical protein